MTLSPEWILGTIMALMLAVIGYQFKLYTDIRDQISMIKDSYVRRDDNNDKIAGIERTVADVRLDQKETNAMLVRILVAIGKQV